MPMKFLTEFELRITGLVGYHDEYLLRYIQQVLSDTALTWFAQARQTTPFSNWDTFKRAFLARFRTPAKLETFRTRLRTLWQGDDESTVDYFDKLQSLISELEPTPSADYMKRKFIQKLRKDIRDRLLLDPNSSLSDALQAAIQIESNLVQQGVDDRLRSAHRNDTKSRQSSAQSTLFAVSHRPSSQPHHFDSSTRPSTSSASDHPVSIDHDANFNQHHSRTYTNSNRVRILSPPLPSRSPSYHSSPPPTSRSTTFHRWCPNCSSSSHSWSHCYSNPNGFRFRPPSLLSLPQSYPDHPTTHASNHQQSIHNRSPSFGSKNINGSRP